MRSSPLRLGQLPVLALLGTMLLPASFSRADAVWLRNAGSKSAATKLSDVKFDKFEKGELYFTVQASSRQTHKKLADIAQVQLDDEPALSAAEAAFDGKDYKTAVDAYTKAAATSSRDWVKRRSGLRLIEAGQASKDLVTQASGFATLAAIDPEAAQAAKPALPDDLSKEAAEPAIARVRQAESTPGLSADAAKVLINFRIELLTASKNTDGANAALQELQKMSGGGGVNTADAGGGKASRANSSTKLNEARVAISQGNFKAASDTITASSAEFTEPDQQAEALYLLAQCKEGQAGNDPKALADAGIAYMRVVAHFKSAQGAPHVAEALLKTASIEEKLNKSDEALKIYNQVASQFEGTAAAKQASQDASRVTAALKAKG